MVSRELRLAASLSKKGAHHLQYLELLSGLEDLHDPQAEYDFAIERLAEHKKICSGCTGGRIVQLAASPEELKLLLEDFKQRTSKKWSYSSQNEQEAKK